MRSLLASYTRSSLPQLLVSHQHGQCLPDPIVSHRHGLHISHPNLTLGNRPQQCRYSHPHHLGLILSCLGETEHQGYIKRHHQIRSKLPNSFIWLCWVRGYVVVVMDVLLGFVPVGEGSKAAGAAPPLFNSVLVSRC